MGLKTYRHAQMIPRHLARRVRIPYLILHSTFPLDAVNPNKLSEVTRRQDKVVERWQGLQRLKSESKSASVQVLFEGCVKRRDRGLEGGTRVVE